MRKILSIVTTIMFLGIGNSMAETGMGITGNFASVEASGSETLRNGGDTTSGSIDNDVVVPEIFIELIGDRGALGVAYIPVQELGKKSRSDSNTRGDTGTYTAEAEVDSHVMVYGDLNLTEMGGQTIYAKGGIAHAKISTLEDLNSGSTYKDQNVWGTTIGLGMKGDLGSGGLYYKLDVTKTVYDEYRDTNSTGNQIKADTDIVSGKVSLGYKF